MDKEKESTDDHKVMSPMVLLIRRVIGMVHIVRNKIKSTVYILHSKKYCPSNVTNTIEQQF